MSIRISWVPSAEADIASYAIQRADDLIASTWAHIASVPHNLTGPNFDVIAQKFVYNDAVGSPEKYYRLIAIDLAGNHSAPSTPFQAAAAGPVVHNIVKVDHNYGTPAALRYQTSGGAPVEGAVIRIFKKSDFDQGLTSVALAVAQTNVRGDWATPVFLTTGFSYVISFAKEGLYGPDKTEIVV